MVRIDYTPVLDRNLPVYDTALVLQHSYIIGSTFNLATKICHGHYSWRVHVCAN